MPPAPSTEARREAGSRRHYEGFAIRPSTSSGPPEALEGRDSGFDAGTGETQDHESRVPNPDSRSPAPLRPAEVRPARRSASVVAATGAGAVAAAAAAGRVVPRFIGTTRNGIARLVHHLLAALGPRAGSVTGVFVLFRSDVASVFVLFRCGVAPVARLFAECAAQLRACFRRQQHAEPCSEHGAGQQAHHESAAAAAFVVIPIKAIRHSVAPPSEWPATSIEEVRTFALPHPSRAFGRTARCAPSLVQEAINRRTRRVEESDGTLKPRIDRRAYPPRRFVNAVDRVLNGGIHPFRSSADPRRHVAKIAENRINARHQRVRTSHERRDLALLDFTDGTHRLAIEAIRHYAEPNQQNRLEDADRCHDPQQQICRVQTPCIHTGRSLSATCRNPGTTTANVLR